MVEPTSANSSSNKEDNSAAEVGQSAPPKGVHTEILDKHYEAFGGTDSQIYP